MHTEINQIVQQFFRQDTLEQVSEAALRQFVSEYPYVTAGHLLLAKKEYDSGRDAEETLRDTALFVSNPLWLQWILDASRFKAQTDLIIHQRPQETDSNEQEPMTGINIIVEETTTEVDINHAVMTGQETKAQQPVQAAAVRQEDDRSVQDATTIEMNETVYAGEEAASETDAITETSANEVEIPLFQSYHTVDYFASQGIRLQQADLGKDKLGQQLRSFTEWLRSMKRLPQMATGEEDPSEQTVKVIAEHSIEEREVLTEAMAEVWAKQGNKKKASDIYRKLSLLNPAKSTYFAAKIDHL